MKLADIKPGMTLNCVGDYGGCIHKGRSYPVIANRDGKPSITCDEGSHELGKIMIQEGHEGTDAELPEFEPA